MPYKIFIDLKPKDQSLAKDLSRRLEKAGVQVLPLEDIDETDFKIKGNSGLRQADEVILLVTPNSVDSKRLVFDMGVAASLEKPVTTIVRGVEPKDLPPIINETIYITYSNLDKYISDLQRRTSAAEGKSKQTPLERMKEALRSEKFTWRTVKTLAVAGRVTESEALNILRNDPDVVLGSGKSGNRLAKLKDR
ncbi:MAG TPA: TIR domain-containing protein [Pyrinomonadaceae bacterium]